MSEKKRIPPKAFVKSTDYLPDIMRDFHDQKDIFKAIHETTAVEKHAYAGTVDWVTGQCYVVDIFLWWMAQRGYTLQRSRQSVEFRDLHEDVAASHKGRGAAMASLIGLIPRSPSQPERTTE